MYCSAELPKTAESQETPLSEEELAQKARVARSLLSGLNSEARSLMPAEALQQLEEAAQGGAGGSPAVSGSPNFQPPAPVAEAELIEPSPDESIPELKTLDLVPLLEEESVETVSPQQAVEAEVSIAASRVDSLMNALSRGGGPFGRRDAPVRLILLPHSSHRRRADELREVLHEATGLDLYTVGHALQKETPTLLGTAETLAEAEAIAAPLWAEKLKVLVLPKEVWLQGTAPENVVSAYSEDPQVVVFVRPDGSSLRVGRGTVRWAALGEIEPNGMTSGTAGERGAAAGIDMTRGSYLIMDLLRRGHRPPVRIRSDEFDFSCLGEIQALSANINLRRLLSWLTRDPDNPELLIPLDESFKRVPHLPGAGGDIEVVPGERPLVRREVEFTEYVLLLDARHHL
ncbi:MAG: hypothetical protein VX498_08020 [Myxococcota bacterium]|nr:hypothetical protein [Myxococcota bacterium]